MFTARDFERKFATTSDCVAFLLAQRFPDGFVCPRCQGSRGWALKTRPLIQCATCRYQASLTAGTIFHRTRTPLVIWFRVIAQMLESKAGLSAVDVGRHYGLRYETAWLMLHKIRSALDQRRRAPLWGTVDLDAEKAKTSDLFDRRVAKETGAIVAAVEHGENGAPARLRMAHLPGLYDADEFRERTLHRTTVVRTRYGRNDPAVSSPIRELPHVRRVFLLFKHLMLGAHQGAVSPKHLQRYIDEFVYRYNRRNSRPYLSFFRVFELFWIRSVTYRELVTFPSPAE